MKEEKEFYTIMEFSEILRWHPNTIRKMIKRAEIQAIKSSHSKKASYRIPCTEVNRIKEIHMEKLIEDLAEEKARRILEARKV